MATSTSQSVRDLMKEKFGRDFDTPEGPGPDAIDVHVELGRQVCDSSFRIPGALRILESARRGIHAGLDLPEKTEKAVERILAGDAIHAARVNYCMAVRARIFDAARKKLQALLPQKMSTKVRAKVMAIRTPLKMGGPPTQAERALIERAAMKRTRTSMMASLHRTADAVAVGAAKDENLVAAYLAKAIRAKLPDDKTTAFDAALKAAGITGDEAACLAQAEERIASIIETYDPDLNGIVDPKTGKVIVKD